MRKSKVTNQHIAGSSTQPALHHLLARIVESLMMACRYLIVILSNQGGISLKSDSKTAKMEMKRLTDFKRKVTAVFTHLDLPLSIYAATGKDRFRKPRIGMWEQLLRDAESVDANSFDPDSSFFVGDAGGRSAAPGGPAKDFSSSDR